jgi:hypothetical protein
MPPNFCSLKQQVFAKPLRKFALCKFGKRERLDAFVVKIKSAKRKDAREGKA